MSAMSARSLASTVIQVDPICGMVVEPDAAAITYTYAGWTYLFCCQDCCDRFRRAPDSCVLYLAHSRSAHVGYRCQVERKRRQPQGDLR